MVEHDPNQNVIAIIVLVALVFFSGLVGLMFYDSLNNTPIDKANDNIDKSLKILQDINANLNYNNYLQEADLNYSVLTIVEIVNATRNSNPCGINELNDGNILTAVNGTEYYICIIPKQGN